MRAKPQPRPEGPDPFADHPVPASPSGYPAVRMRRNRADAWNRRLVAETRLSADDLIWPLFVREPATPAEIASLPGIRRHLVEELAEAVGAAAELGVPAVALFPATPAGAKSWDGAEALNPDNLMCRAIRAVKQAVPAVGIITDVALDAYTTHGHDGLLVDGRILNDETVELLVRQALVQAQAGADVVAPSDMMDGRVGAIRAGLDEAGFVDVRIMSYAAKYASALYRPFRDALGSQGVLAGDKKTYQMDPANAEEALREVALDLAEGADMVMVKPGLPYLDIIHRVRRTFGVPTFAYQVSGEYAMLLAASQQGWLDHDLALIELLTAFKRAGCSGVLTYGATRAAKLLKDG